MINVGKRLQKNSIFLIFLGTKCLTGSKKIHDLRFGNGWTEALLELKENLVRSRKTEQRGGSWIGPGFPSIRQLGCFEKRVIP